MGPSVPVYLHNLALTDLWLKWSARKWTCSASRKWQAMTPIGQFNNNTENSLMSVAMRNSSSSRPSR